MASGLENSVYQPLHDHPEDRTAERFAGQTTVHTGGKYASFLLLPVIPPAC